MEDNLHLIPGRIALLMVGYLHKTLTEQEQLEFDDWVGASLDNQKIFEAALEMTLRTVQPDLDEADTDEAEDRRELIYTAELIIRHLKNTITEEETKYLNGWVELSPANAELLASLPRTADMEFLFNCLRMRVLETHYREHLN